MIKTDDYSKLAEKFNRQEINPEGMDLQERFQKGVNTLCDTVKVTLGAKGKTVLFNNSLDFTTITKDGVTVAKHVHSENAFEEMAIKVFREACNNTVNSSGDGPQPLYSKVFTPTGFVKMGELKVGDVICGTNKSNQVVEGVFKKGNLRIYKMIFADGQIVECSENHLWTVYTSLGKIQTMTTKQLMDSKKVKIKKSNGDNTYGYYVPRTIVDFNDNSSDLLLDPFLIGLLLGDGSLCDTGSVELSLALNQEYVLDKIVLPKNIKFTSVKNLDKNYLRVKFSRIEPVGPTMHDYLKQIGLLNHKSNDKFIPKQYLYSNLECRKKLLDGLTETDGHINKRNLLEYSTISKQLAENVVELLRGLGRTVSCKLHFRKPNSSYSSTPIYRITELKGYKKGNKLINIEETELFTEMQCIKVSNPDHLYITDDYIVTHNTTSTLVLAQALYNNCLALLKSKQITYYQLKKQLLLLQAKTIKQLDKNSIPVRKNISKLYNIASTAANDSEIGNLIYNIVKEISVHGDIEVQEGYDSPEIEVEIVKGMRIYKGWESPVFCNDTANTVYENKDGNYILLFDGILRDIKQIAPFIEIAIKEQKGLAVFVEDCSPILLQEVKNMKIINKGLSLVIVKHDGYGDIRYEILDDMSILTSASIVNPNSIQASLDENYYRSLLGYANHVKSELNTTSIIGGVYDEDTLENHIAKIKSLLDEDKLTFNQRKTYQKRYGYLNGGVAIVKVGGETIVKMRELKDRVDDAVLATKSAIRDGVSYGGSYTWNKIFIDSMQEKPSAEFTDTETAFYRSIRILLLQLLYNADIPTENYHSLIENSDQKYKAIESQMYNLKQGIDLRDNKFVDLKNYDVYDSTAVLKDVLVNAITVSLSLLSVEKAVFDGKVYV